MLFNDYPMHVGLNTMGLVEIHIHIIIHVEPTCSIQPSQLILKRGQLQLCIEYCSL